MASSRGSEVGHAAACGALSRPRSPVSSSRLAYRLGITFTKTGKGSAGRCGCGWIRCERCRLRLPTSRSARSNAPTSGGLPAISVPGRRNGCRCTGGAARARQGAQRQVMAVAIGPPAIRRGAAPPIHLGGRHRRDVGRYSDRGDDDRQEDGKRLHGAFPFGADFMARPVPTLAARRRCRETRYWPARFPRREDDP